MMKKYNNNILVLFMLNGRKFTYSIPSDMTRKEGLFMALDMDKIDPKNIQKAYFIPEAEFGSTTFDDSFSIKGSIDVKLSKINERLPQIRKERDFLLQKLDVEFMKVIEDENPCLECKRHIVNIKDYLRNVPNTFINFEFEDVTLIGAFNILDNVFYVRLIEEGSGYSVPPKITIEKPNNHPSLPGFPLEARALTEDGKVKDVIVTQVGSSYLESPEVTIAPPDEEGGKQATASAVAPEINGVISPIIMKALSSWMDATKKREENSNNSV